MRGTTAAIRTRLGAGQAAPGPESRNRDALLAALACLALAMGVLVYLADREPSHAALIPSVQVLAASHLFGTLGQWLPSFVHPFAFSLLAAAALPPRMARRYGACAAWCAVNVLFEIGQHPQVSAPLAHALQRWFGTTWPTRALANYFLRGTFDVGDILAAMLGALAAAGVLYLFRPVVENDHAS